MIPLIVSRHRGGFWQLEEIQCEIKRFGGLSFAPHYVAMCDLPGQPFSNLAAFLHIFNVQVNYKCCTALTYVLLYRSFQYFLNLFHVFTRVKMTANLLTACAVEIIITFTKLFSLLIINNNNYYYFYETKWLRASEAR